MTVAAMLKHKGNSVITVAPATSAADIAGVMSAHRIGAVAVMEEDGRLGGLVSERDIVRALATDGAAALDFPARRIMTAEVVTATSRTTVAEAMRLMTDGRFRHLPILDGTRLVGIVSIGDVVKARIMQQEGEVESLRSYVAGTA